MQPDSITLALVKIKLSPPSIPSELARLGIDRDHPTVITTNFSDTEIKVEEAAFFLDLVEQNASHQAIIYFGLSAFLAAARSITLYLQAEGQGRDGFDQWYEEQRVRLKDNPVAVYLKGERDTVAHARYSAIRTIFDVPVYRVADGWVYRPEEGVGVGFSLDGYLTENGLVRCREYLTLLRTAVAEARTRGYLPEVTSRRVSLEARDEGRKRQFEVPGSTGAALGD